MQRLSLPLLRAWLVLGSAMVALAGCAYAPAPGTPPSSQPPPLWPDRLQSLLPADVLLLGEQHDAPDHQRLQREAVAWLAARGLLAAVVMEMAERGHSTQDLPRDASEAQARAALQWDNAAWPWQAYGPVVMAAVGAGVPVLGGNLPRVRMRAAMADTSRDQHLPAPALAQQYQALRDGHCGLLPESQIAPMARIQIARDASMAQTALEALRPGQTVLLVAGGGHVLRHLGIPTHWPANVLSKVALAQVEHAQGAIKSGAEADAVISTPALPPRDVCAELREQWRPAPLGQKV
ncbi:ChaN family lipoprotein [Acidovorax sp.]|uniref:ChaN family lipoprotein n=1 Tax=Acidovorax sp. TaxID=1872122 RepID=UPI0025C11229|nr:ChaN family lipoprotein [Acidovorax sp.]MBL7088063.1 ChaN family lipoprotein [Acidovorax sp.]